MNKMLEQLKKELESYYDQIAELRKKATDTKAKINQETLKEHNIKLGDIMTNYKGDKFVITKFEALFVRCNKIKKDGTPYKKGEVHTVDTIVETWKVVGHTDL